MTDTFKALLVTEEEDRTYTHEIVEQEIKPLAVNELLIQVKYSSLNYKDALSLTGNKGVTRNYPHTPGIDAAGIVEKSTDKQFKPGDQVIVTGFDLGMNTAGGFSEYIRIPSEWAIPLPNQLSLQESMIYGTAGFTAALSVNQLLKTGLQPSDGKILVTGATGGVGSVAIILLDKLDFDIVAVSGKPDEKERLLKLGAKEVIDHKTLENPRDRALLAETWAGAVDTLGGDTLSAILKSLKYGASVTSCGNITSGELNTSIYPFILRGVSILGIDSVNTKIDTRQKIWTTLADEWKTDNLKENSEEISLAEVPAKLQEILAGKHVGRTIVNLEI